ncbi:hypothetical protein IAS59_003832 [Cryptococcus gattii]
MHPLCATICDTGCSYCPSVNTSSLHPSRIIFIPSALFFINFKLAGQSQQLSLRLLHRLIILSASSPPLAAGSWKSNTDALKPCFTVTHCIPQNAEPGFLLQETSTTIVTDQTLPCKFTPSQRSFHKRHH